MSQQSLHGLVRRLETKPRNRFVPFVVDVYDASMPVGSARVVARCDTRTGEVWRTSGSTATASMREIRDAIAYRREES